MSNINSKKGRKNGYLWTGWLSLGAYTKGNIS
jgi:hypothetical protein